jgi:hypothetical protein
VERLNAASDHDGGGSGGGTETRIDGDPTGAASAPAAPPSIGAPDLGTAPIPTRLRPARFAA